MIRGRDVAFWVQSGGQNRRLKWPVLIAAGLGLVLLVAVSIFILHRAAADNPVPADVQKSVSFPVYYPKQADLPNGFALDTTSFRLAEAGVIIYSINAGSRQLVVSEEQTPGGNVVDKFTSSYIPLHNTITTDLGKAAIGAAGQGSHLQTLASLPITNGPWLIITAPSDTKQSDIEQIFKALTK